MTAVHRRWICTYTKDVHKKKKKRWEDGVFDLYVDGGTALLYRADDNDGEPVGEALAKKTLSEKEIEALLEGDTINDFEGYDVEPDEEVGGRDDGGGSGGISAVSGGVNDTQAGLGRCTAAGAAAHPGTRFVPVKKPFKPSANASAAVRQPFKAPPRIARPVHPPRAPPHDGGDGNSCRLSDEDGFDRPAKTRRTEEHEENVEAYAELPIPVPAVSGFADLYREEGVSRGGGGRQYSASHMPLTARRSKWAAYAEQISGEEPAAPKATAPGRPVFAPVAPPPTGAGGGSIGEGARNGQRLGGLVAAIPEVKGGGGGNVDSGVSGGLGGLAAAFKGRGDLKVLAARLGSLSSSTSAAAGAAAATMPSFGAPVVPPFRPTLPHRQRGTQAENVTTHQRWQRGGLALGKPSDKGDLELHVEFLNREGMSELPSKSAFGTTREYQAYFCEALRGGINLRLSATRSPLDTIQLRRMQGSHGGGCRGGRGGDFGSGGSAGSDDGIEVARQLSKELRQQKYNIEYYAACTLRFDRVRKWISNEEWNKRGRGGRGGRGQRNKAGDDDNDGGDRNGGHGGDHEEKTFLYLNDPGERRKGSAYSKRDLWVVSSSPYLRSPPLAEVGDRSKAPWVMVVQSLWHGPDNQGKLEVKLISAKPRHALRPSQQVYAVRAFDGGSSLDEFENVADMNAESFPLWPHILGGPIVDERASEGQLVADAAALADRHGLNGDQATAVAGALAAAEEAGRTTPLAALTVSPVRLVHGPFGSGKTHMLASFIISAAERLTAAGSPARILVSAHTNVAVDRLLTTLIACGFTDFVRVGALRRIDHDVLPYSLHCRESTKKYRGGSGGGDEADDDGVGKVPTRGRAGAHAAELRVMLKDATSARQRATLLKELEAIKAGDAARRSSMLGKCRVVGVTTASCGNEAMKGMTFAVVVLDECSQMTEPSSLLAMTRFGCRALVAVGDPKQLPPVLESSRGGGDGGPLAKAMFVRLSEAGHKSVLLRAQYRLHPKLAAVPNDCFYDGKLVDGCSEEQRRALVCFSREEAPRLKSEREGEGLETARASSRPMPPLMWIDVPSGREQYEPGTKSKFSPIEARAAAMLAARVVDLGICPTDIGVIALYKAQTTAITRELEALGATHPATEAGTCVRNGDGGRHEATDEARVAARPLAFDGEVQVSTVDAFQGQEKEIIVLSLCGAGGGENGGFITAERVNVALTRAKRHLIVLGNSRDPTTRQTRAWDLCLRAAQKSPGGYAPTGSSNGWVSTLQSKLDKWHLSADAAAVEREEKQTSEESDDSLVIDEDVFEKNPGDVHESDTDSDDLQNAGIHGDGTLPTEMNGIEVTGARDASLSDGGENGWGFDGGDGEVAGKGVEASDDEGWGCDEDEDVQAWGDTDSAEADVREREDDDDDKAAGPHHDKIPERDERERVGEGGKGACDTKDDESGCSDDKAFRGGGGDADASIVKAAVVDLTAVTPDAEPRAGLHDQPRGTRQEYDEADEGNPVSPVLDMDSLPPERLRLHAALASLAVPLTPRDYWLAYSNIMRGSLYGEIAPRRAVEASPLGEMVAEEYELGAAPWNWDSGRLRRVLLKEVMPGLETFVHATLGWRWTRLSNLIANFDDGEALALEVGGFGAHVVWDAATQTKDEEGAEAFMRGEDGGRREGSGTPTSSPE